MTKERSNQNSKIPQWQSEKMKTMIAEKWHEVWLVVETREQERTIN